MKRIYSLDLLKLVFAYLIAFFHLTAKQTPGFSVSVPVFFILSGFFLAKKFYGKSYPNQGRNYNQWSYTLDHAKALYPHYLLSLVMIFLYMLARSVVVFLQEPALDKLGGIVRDFYNQIPDLLLLQSAYHFHDSLNYPLWQLSALLISGYFVYGLLCHNEKLSREILFPAAILMIQSLLYSGVDIWGNYGFFYMPLLRAFSPLCIGVLAFYFTTTPYYEKIRKKRILFNLASIASLVTLFVFGDYANIYLVTSVIVIWACYEESSWINRLLNRRIFRYCGAFSFAIYANHALIARFLQARVFPYVRIRGTALSAWQENLAFFVLLTVYSMVTLFFVEKWKARKPAAV